MKIAICVDNDMNISFNDRRQSRDRALIEDFLELTKNDIVYASERSESLFADYADQVIFDDDFMELAEEDDYCFVENMSVREYADSISEVVLYRWNREYPGDMQFDLPMGGYVLKSSDDFKGTSHDNISRDIFLKK